MAEKNYEEHQARLRNFRDFVATKGWTIVEGKEIDYGFQFTIFDGLTKNPVAFFPSGKILVQGKDGNLKTALLLWRQEFNPSPSRGEIQAQLTGADTQPSLPATSLKSTGISRIGIDESGKGDYFGPLVIGAVFVDAQTEAQLIALGVRDSKLLSDVRILILAEEIKKLSPYVIVPIGPKRYNEAYEKIQNLNSLLAWGHARALENMLEKVSCDLAISDQFANATVLQKALMQKGRKIKLEQRPHAESDVAVAAASIVARATFVQQTEQLSIKFGKTLPKGASNLSIAIIGREIVIKHGKEALAEVAKLHFKTTEKILPN